MSTGSEGITEAEAVAFATRTHLNANSSKLAILTAVTDYHIFAACHTVFGVRAVKERKGNEWSRLERLLANDRSKRKKMNQTVSHIDQFLTFRQEALERETKRGRKRLQRKHSKRKRHRSRSSSPSSSSTSSSSSPSADSGSSSSSPQLTSAAPLSRVKRQNISGDGAHLPDVSHLSETEVSNMERERLVLQHEALSATVNNLATRLSQYEHRLTRCESLLPKHTELPLTSAAPATHIPLRQSLIAPIWRSSEANRLSSIRTPLNFSAQFALCRLML